MSLKPVEEVNSRGVFSGLVDTLLSRERAVNLCFPQCLTQIRLTRVYRCTQNISTFHEEISKSLNKSTTNFSPKINTSSKSPKPGHEIHGESPEILFLSKCSCFFYCEIPVEHLLKQNQTKIITLLKRIQTKLGTKITVIIDISTAVQDCVVWLKAELQKESLIRNIDVKSITECRGLEFSALVTISNEGYRVTRPLWKCSLIDVWTRVTSALFIVHMERRFPANVFSNVLKDALEKQVALIAEEQQ